MGGPVNGGPLGGGAGGGSLFIRKNSGANVGTRGRLNLIEGTGLSLTVTDDAVDGEIDVTFTATASYAGSLTMAQLHAFVMSRATLIRGS